MAGPQPWEIINDPDLYRENSNINAGIVIPLAMLDSIKTKMDAIKVKLDDKYKGVPYRGGEWKPQQTPMHPLLPKFSNWTRGEGMKGSEQSVRSMLGVPQGSQEGLGQGPVLTPPRPNSPSTVAVVAYNGAKGLHRDIKRKRWGI